MVKYIDHREYIFYDFYLTKSKKYYFTDLNSVLKYLYNNQISTNYEKLNVYIINKYFPNINDNKSLKLLQNNKLYENNLKISNINFLKKNIIENQFKINTLYKEYQNDYSFSYYILSCFLQANEDNESIGNYINLEKIFNLYSPKILTNNIRYILLTDVETNGVLNNIVKINKNYFNTDIIKNEKNRKKLKEELLKEHKKNRISFKFTTVHNDKETNINLQLKPNGYQKMFITWNEEQLASIKNLDKAVKDTSLFIDGLNKKNIFDNRHMSIEPPSISSVKDITNQNSNTHIIHIKYNVNFKLKEKIDFNILEKIIDFYDTHVNIIDDEEILIDKLQGRNDFNLIINRLRKLKLLSISKLSRLSIKEWNNLVILDNKIQNKLLIDKLIKLISVNHKQELQFIYKRFSDYKTNKRINTIIEQYIKNNNINYYTDICDKITDLKKNINYYSEIEREEVLSNNGIIDNLRKKVNIEIDEAIDRVLNWCNENKRIEKRGSIGIKCNISEVGKDENNDYNYKIEIGGIKHFTSSFYYGNINELIIQVYLFLKKCIDIYLSYKDKTLDKELTKKIKNNNIEKSGSINSSIKDTLFDEKHNDLKPDPELTDEINFEEETINTNDLLDNFSFDFDNISLLNNTLNINNTNINNTNNSNNTNNTNNTNNSNNTNRNSNSNRNSNRNNNINTISNTLKNSSLNQNDYIFTTKLDELRKKQPQLFIKKKGQKNSFAQNCSPVQRQPIILTEKEYNKLDAKKFSKNEGAKLGFNYHGYYYVCPDIYCPVNKQVVSESDLTKKEYKTEKIANKEIKRLVSGVCPTGENAILPEKGLIINDKKLSEKELYRFPGFFEKSFHPEGICVPCCMKNDQSEPGRSKYNLFNECLYKKKSEDDDKKVVSKYIYKELKKLGENRLGFIDDTLDSYLNERECYLTNLIKDNNKCFLRYGTSKNNSFIDSIYKVYKLNNILNNKKSISLEELKNNISEYILKNKQFFLSLNKGDLDFYINNNIIIKNQSNQESFSSLIKNFYYINEMHIYDLISRPLPFLFKNGINIVIFSINSDNKINMKCFGSSFNKISKEYCYLFNYADKDNEYEILVYNDNGNYKTIFNENEVPKQILEEFSKCNINDDKKLNIYKLHKIIESNKKIGSDYSIKYQVYDDYNKVFGAILKNGLYIPLDLSEIYVNDDIKIINIKEFANKPLLDYNNTLSFYKKFIGILPLIHKQKYEINSVLYDNSNNYYGFETNDNKIVFFKNNNDKKISSSKINKINRDNLLNIYLNKDYEGKVSYYDKLYLNKYSNLVYKRLRYELYKFLNDEIKENKDKYYIITIISILNSNNTTDEKRNILYNLFFNGIENLKALKKILISDNHNTKNLKENDINFEYCQKLKNKESCNKNNFCDFYNNSCKFYLHDENENIYIYYLIEELLLLKNKKEELLYLGIDNNIKELSNEDYFIIDKISFTNMMQVTKLNKQKNEFGELFNKNYRPNYELLKNKNNLKEIENDYDKSITYNFIKKQLIPNLKEKFSYIYINEFNNYLSQKMEDRFTIININYGHLYDIMYYITSAKNNKIKFKEESHKDVKYRVKNVFNKDPALWYNILKKYKQYSPIYNDINKYKSFLEFFVSSKHLGYNEDLILIQKTYKINIILINLEASNDKNAFVCLGGDKNLDKSKIFIMLGYGEPNKYSIIGLVNLDKTYKTTFKYDELPKLVIDNLNICSN